MSIRLTLTVAGLVGLLGLGLVHHATLSAEASSGVGPDLESTGPLTFGPGGVLFVADNRAATIYALEMAELVAGGIPGTTNIVGIDQKIAALVGIDVREI